MSSLFRRFLHCIYTIYDASFFTVFHDACPWAARHSTRYQYFITIEWWRENGGNHEQHSTLEKNWTFFFHLLYFLFPFVGILGLSLLLLYQRHPLISFFVLHLTFLPTRRFLFLSRGEWAMWNKHMAFWRFVLFWRDRNTFQNQDRWGMSESEFVNFSAK